MSCVWIFRMHWGEVLQVGTDRKFHRQQSHLQHVLSLEFDTWNNGAVPDRRSRPVENECIGEAGNRQAPVAKDASEGETALYTIGCLHVSLGVVCKRGVELPTVATDEGESRPERDVEPSRANFGCPDSMLDSLLRVLNALMTS